MQAYATPERLGSADPPRRLESSTPVRPPGRSNAEGALFDQLLAQLAELVVDRLLERTGAVDQGQNDWLDARGAAAYLGIHRDTLRKLAAQRAIPAHQDGPRCKLYFRRDELDAWRRSTRPSLRAVS